MFCDSPGKWIALLLAAFAADGDVGLIGGARAQPRASGYIEDFAIRQGNRVKQIEFEDDHSATCPQLTSLIYSAGEKLELVMPSFAFVGVRTFTVAGGRDIVFFNDDCRYTITTRKFVRAMGREEEAHPFADRTLLPRPMPPGLIPEPGPDGPVRAERNRAGKGDYPYTGGFVQLRFSVDGPGLRTQFSGLLFFSPKGMTIYLVNAAADLQIESSQDHASKSYDIDISDTASRTRLSVKKEIRQNGSWNGVLGK